MTANYDSVVLRNKLQIALQPLVVPVFKTETIFLLVQFARERDIVHDNIVYLADVERVVGWGEELLKVHCTQLCIEEGGLVVVVVTDSVEHRHIAIGDHLQVVVEFGHVVEYEVAEVDGEEFILARRLILLQCYDIRIDIVAELVTCAIDLDTLHLRVANHRYRIFLNRLLSLFEYEVCTHSLNIARDTQEVLRHALAECELIFRRGRDCYEANIVEIRLDLIVASVVGLNAELAIGNYRAYDRLAIGVGNTAEYGIFSIERLGWLRHVVVEELALNGCVGRVCCDIADAATVADNLTLVCAIDHKDRSNRRASGTTGNTADIDFEEVDSI